MVTMMNTPRYLVLVALLGHAPVARAAETVQVRHLPPAEAEPGRALTLVAEIARGWEATLRVHYRPVGEQRWQTATFRRLDREHYSAEIPATQVQPPGVEYYLVRARDNQVTPSFASGDHPHRVHVYASAETVWRDRELRHYHGRRARVRAATEWVDFGSRPVNGGTINDRYLRIDLDFSYRILRSPLHSLRFGYTRLVGETPVGPRGAGGSCPVGTPAEECELSVGFRVGGWFELRFQSDSGAALDARGMVMATPEGFQVGARGELRLGRELGSHVAAGAEIVADTGTTGFFRLGWGTVPKLPMAATIEVTNLPASHRDLAVRLIYDVARRFEGGVLVGVRVGYQARDQLVGGVSAGLNMALDF